VTHGANGQQFYGIAPPVSVGDTKDGPGLYLPANQWHVGQGRLLPTTSVNEFGATTAKWFGVALTDLGSMFPNLVTCASRYTTGYAGGYMGFMAAKAGRRPGGTNANGWSERTSPGQQGHRSHFTIPP
jgi:hypothetical protein